MIFRILGFLAVFFCTTAIAETINIQQATERALNHDPRISEVEKLIAVAEAQLDEVYANKDFSFELLSYVAMAPRTDQEGFFTKETCGEATPCEVRDDRYALSPGFSPWFMLQSLVVKPLYTFGKIKYFAEAAKANIKVKEEDVRLQRGQTILDVHKAYHGYLSARDARLFLGDVQKRVDSAVDLVQGWLDDDNGRAKQSDLYALQSASGLAASFLAQAQALENIALDGLKVLIGVALDQPLEIADKRAQAVALPSLSLAALTEQALSKRPEMFQLENGMNARRALVAANKAMNRPNLFTGMIIFASYSPLRTRIDNPYVYDVFNDYGATPLVGFQWNWERSVKKARAAQEQAQLDALVEKKSLALQGIPYQVAERYHQVQAGHISVTKLMESSKSARRWMIASYADFEAGLEQTDKIVSAFQGYVLTYTEYLKMVYDYNVQVAQLDYVAGAYQ